MKTLTVTTTTTIKTPIVKVTKSSIKRDAKSLMVESINRPENLVSIYFELKLNEVLREQLKEIKTNGIENLIDCFESDDQSKLVSFLRKVYDLPYFCGETLRGITPQKFINVLIDLCTIKNDAKKNLKFSVVGELNNIYNRPSEYNVEVSFNTSVIEMIFQAYI